MPSAPPAPGASAAAPGGEEDYIAPSLAAADAANYRSAGIVLYDFERSPGQRLGARGVLRLLMGRNHENKIEFLGGKRETTDEDVHATASREFDEESGGILGESAGDVSQRATLARACRSSRVLWCALSLRWKFMFASRA